MKRRWPRRLGTTAVESLLPAKAFVPLGYQSGDRVVILSTAELRYLDRCRRELERRLERLPK